MLTRVSTVIAVLLLAGSLRADQGAAAIVVTAGLSTDVRTALGHGSIAEATRLVDASREPATSKEFASALVEIYQGQDDAARVRLAKLATANPVGDAASELALLDMRHGRRDDARTHFDAIENAKALRTSADLARIAIAGEMLGDSQLAFDAYVAGEGLPSADLQSREGDFLRNRHKPGDAVVCYDRALKIDPRWVQALGGRARAFQDDDPVQAAKALAAAAQVAPNDPDVLVLAAERGIDLEDWTTAAQAIDRLAAAKPGTVVEQGLRAALGVGTDHPEVVEPAAARAKAIDPLSAQVYVKAGEELAQLYRADGAVEFYKKGLAIDPRDRDLQFDLGMALLRTGDESGARTTLDAAWALDKSNPQTKNSLDMLDRLDQFVVVPDGDLIFKFSKEEAPILKLYALPLGEEAMRTFQEHYQFKPKGPILVEIFPRHDDFAVRTIGLTGIEGALGACFGRVVSMDSPHARPPDEFSWQATEWHELAHVFTLQLSNYRVPRWLTEGISVFEEHRRNPAWGREVALQYASLWSQNKTFGVKGLPNAFKDPENFTISYFEASLVVEHLVELKGDAGLRELLLAYGGGAKDEEAFSRAFGQGVDAVDASFRAWVNAHYGPLVAAMKPLGGPPIDGRDVGALRQRAIGAPGSFVAQLTLGQALVATGDDKGATPVLQKAAELAPQARGKASPHALLAEIDVRAGDNGGARRELRSLLTYDHDSVTSSRELAKLASDVHSDVDLDYALQITTDLDPFDAEAHTMSGTREMAAKKAAAALVDFKAAAELNPTNRAEAHANVADALVALNRRDEARHEALIALEDAPTFARAQDLLVASEPAAAVDTARAASGGATLAAAAPSGAPSASGARYAMVVEGVSGDETYAKQHREWLDGMVGALKTKLGFDASHLSVLAETPGAGEQKATAEVVKTTLAGFAKTLKPNDLFFVMLIGHGTGDGADVKFNLVGPDLSVEEWNALLTPIQGRLVFVDATSSSFPFLKGLAGPNRVIVTATRTQGEKFHTVFAEGFIHAFSTSEADLDKNGRISIWEAFAYASKQVAAHYDQAGHMSTEHALLDDTGKGTGRDATAPDVTGSVAALTYLDAVATPTSSDPALQGLYDRQRSLTEQIDGLRRRRSTLSADEFDRAFEPLAIDLSVVSQDIRTKGRR
jgi:tetratricopeptide (TPR) repeat protein